MKKQDGNARKKIKKFKNNTGNNTSARVGKTFLDYLIT